MPPLAFITGASSGIGQALAARFYRAGWRLALVARREAELRSWAVGHGLAGERYRIWAADVRDLAAITGAGRDCIARHGVPDVVIANAGISIGVDTAELADLEIVKATFETNVLGMAGTFQPFVGAMRDRRAGTLVGIASVAGIRGLPGHAAYCGSKAAVIGYLESLRGECRSSGVKVVTITPGYVDTPLTRQNRYAMPFLITPERFADKAFTTIEAGTSYRVIPWQMGVAAKLLRVLPNPLYDLALAGRPRKRRQGE